MFTPNLKNIFENKTCRIAESDVEWLLFIDDKIQLIVPKDINKLKNISEIRFIEGMNEFFNKDLSILNIGLGAGFTVKEILKNNNVKQLDIIEIYNETLEIVHQFNNEDILKDERVKLFILDAFDFLKNPPKTYDGIIVDICQPELQISENFYKKEFFQDLYKTLNNGGFMLFWYFKYLNIHRTSLMENMLKYMEDIFDEVEFIEIKDKDNHIGHYFKTKKR